MINPFAHKNYQTFKQKMDNNSNSKSNSNKWKLFKPGKLATSFALYLCFVAHVSFHN